LKGKDPEERIIHAFRLQIKRIKGRLERKALQIIRDVAKGGGNITETRVTVKTKGKGKRKRTGRETQIIKKESSPVWKAAAWILERSYQEYSLYNRYDMSSRGVDEIALDVKMATDKLFNSIPSSPDKEKE